MQSVKPVGVNGFSALSLTARVIAGAWSSALGLGRGSLALLITILLSLNVALTGWMCTFGSSYVVLQTLSEFERYIYKKALAALYRIRSLTSGGVLLTLATLSLSRRLFWLRFFTLR